MQQWEGEEEEFRQGRGGGKKKSLAPVGGPRRHEVSKNLNIIRMVTSSWNKCGKISTCRRDSRKSRKRQKCLCFPRGFYKSCPLPPPSLPPSLFSSVLRRGGGHCFFEQCRRGREKEISRGRKFLEADQLDPIIVLRITHSVFYNAIA